MKTNIIKTLCITALAAALPVNSLASSAAYSEPETTTAAVSVSEVTGIGTEDDPFTFITTSAADNNSCCVVTSTFEFSDDEDGQFTFSGDLDLSALTEEEQAELNDLYDQLSAIYMTAFPDDSTEYTDEEYNAFYEAHQEELDDLNDRIFELEEKAGLYSDFYYGFDDIDYGDLTEDEIAELNGLYDKLCALFDEAFPDGEEWSDEVYDAIEADNQELFDRINELEQKAGWITEFEVTSDIDMDYGDLTEDEIAELNALFDKLDDIYAQAFPEDREYSDEEYDAFYAEHQEELDKIYERMTELEQKAGWCEEFSFDDELLENALTEEEYAEYQQIIDRFSEIDALVLDGKEDLSDEEIEAGYAQYQDEMDQLIQRLTQLYDQAYGNDNIVFCGSYEVATDDDII
ncbi:MAG TPA: hypothetical protein P5191_03010 [Ruminococcus sp.]|nr:hypothetical protein [Ruminococcus sp.]